jgi:hypothetical protein
MTSAPITAALVASDIVLTVLLLVGLGYVSRVERRPSILVIGGAVIVGWFALAIVLARAGVWETTSDDALRPPNIAFAIAVPTILGSLLVRSQTFMGWIGRVPLHVLVGVQLYRVLGVLFLVAYAQGDMPAEFALPAGIGDVLVGLAAVIVAVVLLKRGERRARPLVLTWCAFGILDLVVAVATGFLSAPSPVQQIAFDDPNAAIVSYPFVLIPTFLVPVSIMLHVYVIARLRTATAPRTNWSARVTGYAGRRQPGA